jgi:putative tryptophan/tyrosine transport system permease protein
MGWLVPLDIGVTMGLLLAWAVLALALAFRLLSFPDLTVEGTLPLGAAVFAILLKNGTPMWAAVAVALVAGAAAGALTAYIHLRFRLNKFLSGIVVVAITYSLSLRVMGASNIGLLQTASIFDWVKPLDGAGGAVLHAGTILLLSALLTGSVSLLVFGLLSRRGMRLRVAGSNPEYARSLGISVPWNLVFGLALTNALAAVSGVLLSMHQGFADIGMGQGILILALAAMTIGERLLPERNLPFPIFVVGAAILGSILYQLLVSYAITLGLAATDLKMGTAILVLVVVALRLSRGEELLSEG